MMPLGESGEPALRVVYADDSIVVVDKPAGMPSVPARTPLDPPCVAHVLRAEYGQMEPAHRLDRDTSGLLVLCRSLAARTALGHAFETRRVWKIYAATVEGLLPNAEGEVHLPLARDPWRPPRQRVDPVSGRPAASRWRVVATETSSGLVRSAVELVPLTGRSHQLRVHMAWLGTPIVGDALYGRPASRAGSERLALRAAWVRLPHPTDGRLVEFSCDDRWAAVAWAASPNG